MNALPTLFISHGSPTFALEPGRLGPSLTTLGKQLPCPRAVLVLSPHWMTRGVFVQSSAQPATVHDFGGFPRPLYSLQYPAAGAPELAQEIVELLGHQGIPAQLADSQGYDHGAWIPMMHLYPDADIPVLQLSQPSVPSPVALLELGQAVAPLREKGVLIVASGCITHNLYEFRMGSSVEPYAQRFADWTWERINDGDLDALLGYRQRAPQAARAHPTDEHLLPLYFAIGAAGNDWTRATRLQGGTTYGVINMDSFVFGQHTDAGQLAA